MSGFMLVVWLYSPLLKRSAQKLDGDHRNFEGLYRKGVTVVSHVGLGKCNRCMEASYPLLPLVRGPAAGVKTESSRLPPFLGTLMDT